MRKHSIWVGLRKTLTVLSVAGTIAFLTAGACINVQDSLPFMKNAAIRTVVQSYKPYALWIALFAPIAIGALQVCRKNIGEPWTWDAIHHLLNDFEERMFRNKKTGLRRDEHAVTLFKATRMRLFCPRPFGRWLVPVERSGNVRRKSKAAFLLSETGGAGSEGIAGQTFSSELVKSAYDLPDLSERADEAAFQEYAKETFVSEKWARKWVQTKRTNGQKVARSFCAFHVETSHGKPWGVLVLDSTVPNDLQKRAAKYYDTLKSHLSRLVERA